LKHFGEGNKSGYTLVQLIETSNITGHFCDDSGDAYLDVFSCKYFDENVVQHVVNTWFKPESIDMKVLSRDAKIAMVLR
jgi:S-adenosylmethionine/arginine decarboxylase-like enzyme